MPTLTPTPTPSLTLTATPTATPTAKRSLPCTPHTTLHNRVARVLHMLARVKKVYN